MKKRWFVVSALTLAISMSTVSLADTSVDAEITSEAETSEGEAAGTEAADTEAADTEAADTEAAGTEAAGTEAADTEASGTETTDTEAAGTEAAGTEAADTEAADAEAADTEAAGTETADTEAAGTEASGVESVNMVEDAETADEEVVSTEGTDEDLVDIEAEDAEPAAEDVKDVNTVDEEPVEEETEDKETADTETTDTETAEIEIADTETVSIETEKDSEAAEIKTAEIGEQADTDNRETVVSDDETEEEKQAAVSEDNSDEKSLTDDSGTEVTEPETPAPAGETAEDAGEKKEKEAVEKEPAEKELDAGTETTDTVAEETEKPASALSMRKTGVKTISVSAVNAVARKTTVKNGWYTENGKQYWYENGVKQGTASDPKGVWYDGTNRGREIYDPASDAWYWLDAAFGGAKAVSKEVMMPYTFNGKDKTEKWVRYNQNGAMIKSWFSNQKGRYYYDKITGAMYKGIHDIDGKEHTFNNITGIEGKDGWFDKDSKSYWYENGVRQGTSSDPNGVWFDGSNRGREIYDPASQAWYWLDAAYNGAKAVNKEVLIPYTYRGDNQEKWVRYDKNGSMIKGWHTASNKNTYYYNYTTGAMLKGHRRIGGTYYSFDKVTGVYIPNSYTAEMYNAFSYNPGTWPGADYGYDYTFKGKPVDEMRTYSKVIEYKDYYEARNLTVTTLKHEGNGARVINIGTIPRVRIRKNATADYNLTAKYIFDNYGGILSQAHDTMTFYSRALRDFFDDDMYMIMFDSNSGDH